MNFTFTRSRALPGNNDRTGASASKPLNVRTMLAIADLGDVDRRQLVACAGRGSDLRFTVEELFAEGFAAGGGDRKWIVESTEVSFEWWDVVDEDGVTCFQAWFYHADGALVFEAGTTTVRAQGIQYGSAWEIEGEWSPEQIAALGAAHRRASADHPESDLAQHYAFEP